VKIYAGNLSYSVTDDDLRSAFAQFGTVDSADVIIDRNTGRSKGFGFVEMSDANEAKAAIEGLNGKDLSHRGPERKGPQGSGHERERGQAQGGASGAIYVPLLEHTCAGPAVVSRRPVQAHPIEEATS